MRNDIIPEDIRKMIDEASDKASAIGLVIGVPVGLFLGYCFWGV